MKLHIANRIDPAMTTYALILDGGLYKGYPMEDLGNNRFPISCLLLKMTKWDLDGDPV